jgi:predicted XRE-type DNA-binding protein
MPKKKPSPPPEPELQRKIREAEFKNILQKLKDGKTLSAREAKIAEEFAAERDGVKRQITQQEVASAWGITQPAVHKMVKQGMPLDSMESAVAWRKEFLARRGRGDNAPLGYQEARTRKALLECDKLDMQLAIMRGDYEEKTKVREEGIKIGAVLSAKLAALVNDASGALAGLGEAELRKKLHDRTQQILSEIKEELNK